jgi:hypothetical protein
MSDETDFGQFILEDFGETLHEQLYADPIEM